MNTKRMKRRQTERELEFARKQTICVNLFGEMIKLVQAGGDEKTIRRVMREKWLAAESE